MKTKSSNRNLDSGAEHRQKVREAYTSLLKKTQQKSGSMQNLDASSCCGYYSPKDVSYAPQEALQSSFGCGNPLKFTQIREGQTVLDIGSGAGIDCFLAAERVGPSGKVIGLDMTPAMVEKAKQIAAEKGYSDVEFRLGTAEKMPVEDGTVDWIISNCVINLSPDKPAVFREAYRVLKPGGRVSISDIVLGQDLPDEILTSMEAHIGCLAGAIREEEYLDGMRQAGFADPEVTSRFVYTAEHIRSWFGIAEIGNSDGCCGGSGRLAEFVDKYADQLAGQVWSAEIRTEK